MRFPGLSKSVGVLTVIAWVFLALAGAYFLTQRKHCDESGTSKSLQVPSVEHVTTQGK